jgi:hypothetical protein
MRVIRVALQCVAISATLRFFEGCLATGGGASGVTVVAAYGCGVCCRLACVIVCRYVRVWVDVGVLCAFFLFVLGVLGVLGAEEEEEKDGEDDEEDAICV